MPEKKLEPNADGSYSLTAGVKYIIYFDAADKEGHRLNPAHSYDLKQLTVGTLLPKMEAREIPLSQITIYEAIPNPNLRKKAN
jgi:hypothetical protein